jgi:DNA-directed RNA polymerase subunit RPC12/RpoP
MKYICIWCKRKYDIAKIENKTEEPLRCPECGSRLIKG